MTDQAVTIKLKPLGYRILAKRLEAEEKLKGGIILPDTHDEKSQKGKVIALGKTLLTKNDVKIEPEFKVNDVVIYKKWGGDEVKFGISGEELIFVKFEDILAIIK